ncbi:hypothetical protein BWQ96_06388 [Gracilariopsis chorda]|uniref:Uncharacterized protein n=1 Tax=Gracilariopsis chorda TaxID=448386 RepID=A0A2V3IPC0_9FLOR|nr:hypothetical protein BWQ96_06388 [Gracilariopsis chorda]|eukprot:PXF43922.1 hypothetical protein BWQ96_06388 [Gracilariopsis chorda]
MELESLVGQLPPNRLIAQQWKGAMQRDITKANRKVNRRAFQVRHELQQRLHLSKDNRIVSRCFTILEAVRKRYIMNEAPNPKLLKELKVKLGNFPTSSVDAHRYINALAQMQRDRRLSEKRPPRIPADNFVDLYEASMLLGAYAVHGSVGRQTRRLENLVGSIPRNESIARSWQKQIKAAIRKKRRRERSDQRRQEIERKRLERQLRRIRRRNEVFVGTPCSEQKLASEKYTVPTQEPVLPQNVASLNAVHADQLQEEVPSLMSCVSELLKKLLM